MSRPTVRIYTEKDVFIDREMNDEEFAQYKLDQAEIAKIKAEESAKAAAKAALLERLGITEEEASVIFK